MDHEELYHLLNDDLESLLIIENILTKKQKQLFELNNVYNIIDIVKTLKQYNLVHILEKCTTILIKGRAKEIKLIINLLKPYPGIIEQCPSILAFGKSKEIKLIIDLLKPYPGIIEQCPTILAQGKSKEINLIIDLLKPYPGIIEQCPSILAFGKSKELNLIIDLLKPYPEVIEQCPTILAQGKLNELKLIIDLLKPYPGIIERCPTILAQGKSKEVKLIIDLLKPYPEVIEQCPSILAFGKSKEIKLIIDLLKPYPEVIKGCPSILAFGKSKEINLIIELLKSYPGIIEQCPSILAFGKSKELNLIIDLLKPYPEVIEQCPTILAQGKLNELKLIIDLLKPYPGIIERCPTILAQGKSREIKLIIDLLKPYPGIIEQCPSILAFGKSKEIKLIINLLKPYPEVIEGCPSILAFGKLKKINESLNILNYDLKYLNIIGYINLINPEKLYVMKYFIKDKIDAVELKKTMRGYFILNDYYNKLYTKDELITIAAKMNITVDYLLSNMVFQNGIINENTDKYYIGNAIPMTKEQLEENKYLVVDMVKLVSASFYKKYKHVIFNYDDIYDYCQDIIISKCGHIFINFANTESIRPILFNYLNKYCFKLLINQYALNNNVTNLQKYGSYDNVDDLDNSFIDKYSFLTEQELFIFKQISQYIELGYDNYIELIEKNLNISKKDILFILKSIKEKIISNRDIKIKNR